MAKAKAEPKKTGRPTDYTEALALKICVGLMEPCSLRRLCEREDVPCKSTVLSWLARGDAGEEPYAAFRAQYEAARVVQADAYQDEMVDIADDGSNDFMAQLDGEGAVTGWKENGEAIRRSDLRIKTRQWNAEKLRPKKYGAKLEVEGDLGLTVKVRRYSAGG